MLKHHNMSTHIPTSAVPGISVALDAAGRNWKEWNKQICNWATERSSLAILKGTETRPPFNTTEFAEYDLETPEITQTMDAAARATEFDRCEQINKSIRP